MFPGVSPGQCAEDHTLLLLCSCSSKTAFKSGGAKLLSLTLEASMAWTSVGHRFCWTLMFAYEKTWGKKLRKASWTKPPKGLQITSCTGSLPCESLEIFPGVEREVCLEKMTYIQGKQHVTLAVNIVFVGVIKACRQCSLAKFPLLIWLGYVYFPEEGIKWCSFVSLLRSWQVSIFCAWDNKFPSEFLKAITLSHCPKQSKEK